MIPLPTWFQKLTFDIYILFHEVFVGRMRGSTLIHPKKIPSSLALTQHGGLHIRASGIYMLVVIVNNMMFLCFILRRGRIYNCCVMPCRIRDHGGINQWPSTFEYTPCMQSKDGLVTNTLGVFSNHRRTTRKTHMKKEKADWVSKVKN